MRRQRLIPVLVLVAALAVLGASAAWALTRGDGWSMGRHHAAGSGWMMGYAPAGRHDGVGGIGQARAHAKAFADRLGLRTDEVLRASGNYYVKLVDKGGAAATEVLVDPATGVVSLEYGPAMMWNTRYTVPSGRGMGRSGTTMMGGRYGAGMMGGANTAGAMMSGGMMGTAPSTTAAKPLSLERARTLARRWLDANRAGVSVETGGDAFPGYDTFETLRDGRIAGMISVNTTTGAVWPHWWHGRFVAEA